MDVHPLHIKVRPKNLSECIGQKEVLEKLKPLFLSLKRGASKSFIFYGPPGTGKTTFALCIKEYINSNFSYINAATSSLEELKEKIKKAHFDFTQTGNKTLLFVDEIHHFNKRQQDIFLSVLEEGYLLLIGATIHNPFFYLIPPLLSRVFVVEFKPFSKEEIISIIENAIKKLKLDIKVDSASLEYIYKFCDGDARRALNILESAIEVCLEENKKIISKHMLASLVDKKIVFYDKDEDAHYDTISAFIKSIRGSDPQASIYYLAKMLYAGEDPLYICRRLLILASEDIGNADPLALVVAQSAKDAIHFVGLPEAEIILAQAVLYLACAPKSNACFHALKEAQKDIQNQAQKEIPSYLKVGSYKGAKILGHGQGYKNPHYFPKEAKSQKYLKEIKTYYIPKDIGFEKKIRRRLGFKE